MKKTLSYLALLFTLNSFSQNTPCSDFKTGEFKYSNFDFAQWIIIRNDSVQIEINKKTGLEIYSSITWKSGCEYSLICKKVINSQSDKTLEVIGKKFHVIISKTFLDRYKCISKKNEVQSTDITLEMIKIK